MTNTPKTVLAIHDLPGFGRAALSVIVPVLSCLGVQAVALPTAVLSTHTGGLLLGDPLPGVGSAEQAAAQAARLTRVAPQVVVTGVTGIGGGRYIGCVGAARGGEGYAVKTPLQPRMFHGTGDIFTSTLTAAYLRDRSLKSAAQIAANFTARCIKKALTDNREERFGVDFETQIPYLIKYLEL